MVAIIAGITLLAIFGGGYAAWIFYRPIRPVWFSVVIGVGGTLVGVTLLLLGLYDRTGREWLILSIWASFAWTGMCQIAAAWVKAEQQFQEAVRILRDTGPLGERES